MATKPKRRVSVHLTPEAYTALKALSERVGSPMAGIIKMWIDERLTSYGDLSTAPGEASQKPRV